MLFTRYLTEDNAHCRIYYKHNSKTFMEKLFKLVALWLFTHDRSEMR